jgi:hypothetical protein
MEFSQEDMELVELLLNLNAPPSDSQIVIDLTLIEDEEDAVRPPQEVIDLTGEENFITDEELNLLAENNNWVPFIFEEDEDETVMLEDVKPRRKRRYDGVVAEDDNDSVASSAARYDAAHKSYSDDEFVLD